MHTDAVRPYAQATTVTRRTVAPPVAPPAAPGDAAAHTPVAPPAAPPAHTPAAPGDIALAPGTAVVVRPGGHLQFGIHPDRAVVLPLPGDVAAGQVARVFLDARTGLPHDALTRALAACGIDLPHATGIVGELLRAGVLHPREPRRDLALLGPTRPVDDLLRHLDALGLSATVVHPAAPAWAALDESSTVVLVGGLFPPADVTADLMRRRVPHLPSGVLDRRIVVGPLVTPGVTPCLTCIDHDLFARDSGWRMVRGQAGGRPAAVPAAWWDLTAAVTAHVLAAADGGGGWRGNDAALPTPTGSPADLPRHLGARRSYDPATMALEITPVRHAARCAMCRLAREHGEW
ncbi:hypothetical protein [Corynebacterium bovis]|uniref:hypothetical protein n=2 Tax=Corynebacterium bovis TaxID=36808 RepID=UPI000F987F1A|nr:hypothetical protein [Corynebacterium bovis]RRQ06665.1 hypothetical protein CXF43_08035 [Corynebacterium bovis]RRQ08764.1 hypothetical protein CXF44_10530 [Corynebacterium bovis]